jgi:16S rRNA (adenine1518-N6/adenine1519-N6)-dimethyltransferase
MSKGTREKKRGVRAKKALGQHFLHDQKIASRIVDSLLVPPSAAVQLLEIGPGMGILTRLLRNRPDIDLKVLEIDRDSVAYLKEIHLLDEHRVIEGDVLQTDLSKLFPGHFSIIGNFPYNISSQIFFKVLQHRQQVDQVVCMLQKEVAERIASPHGSKVYGILSVLLQAYFDIELLFKVSPGVFSPPPKVMSAVIRLTRNKTAHLACSESLFITVVKQGFNNRRKTLRNALKNLNLAGAVSSLPLLDKRAEQLTVEDFAHLTRLIEESRAGTSDGI